MLNSICLNSVFDFFPAFDLGMLWSFLKVDAPVRPIPLAMRDKPISWITHFEGDPEGWTGIVYSSQDGQRLMYVPFRADSKLLVDEARYLTIAPLDYVNTATRLKHSNKRGGNFSGLYSEIEYLRGDSASAEDRAWVDRCAHPDRKPSASSDSNITLG